jgi:hypothetical protein
MGDEVVTTSCVKVLNRIPDSRFQEVPQSGTDDFETVRRTKEILAGGHGNSIVSSFTQSPQFIELATLATGVLPQVIAKNKPLSIILDPKQALVIRLSRV